MNNLHYINIETRENIKILTNLACEIWHEYWPCLLSNEQIDYMLNKFQSFESINDQIKNNNYIYNIIENNSQFVGYFGICLKKDYLFLSKLYLKKEFRHKGFGKTIFNKIIQLAKQYNKPKIQLTVNKYNINTINAYKKWGFTEINAVVTDIGHGFVMDDYIMEYNI